MSIQVESTKIPGVIRILPKVHEDFRGEYVPLYNQDYDEFLPKGTEFVEDDISVSRFGTLRGIHGDDRTWKLVSCLHGSFYLVVVDWRSESSYYKSWESFTLSDRNRMQVLIPAGCGNGHLILTEIAIFHYKQSQRYQGAEHQFTIPYNHPDLNIYWPHQPLMLSERDNV